ncbi:MAG: DUF1800 domain-containing protein [Saprospiraceae bacterium]
MVKPYTGNFGEPELMHLLRRTLFGASPSDLNFFKGKTLEEVVNSLLNFSANPPSPPIRAYQGKNQTTFDSLTPFGQTWINTKIIAAEQNPNGVRRGSYKQWWMQLMAQQERTMREKLVLFWHNHLVTDSNDVVSIAQLAYRYNALLRANCAGNFRKLIYDMTIEPAMLRYLNGEKSIASAPDENYGRELQELFCVGKGPDSKYTEDDVKAAAKVLTGWTINYADDFQPVFRANRHDNKDKQFSAFYNNKIIKGDNTANGGSNEINQFLDMIFANQEVAKFIVRKFFTFFCYYEITDETESNLIVPLADEFRSSGYELKPMLRSLFTSEWFFKNEYRGAMIKSPADYTIGMIRQMEIDWPSAPLAFEARYYFSGQIYNAILAQGQEIGDPPNVAGWPAYYQTPSFYELWIDTALYPPRLAVNDTLVIKNLNTGGSGSTQWINAESKQKVFKIDPILFVSKLSKPSDPNVLINEVVFFFYGASISQSIKDSLKTTYLLKGQATDYYWTDAYNNYINNPGNPGTDGRQVPKQLQDLFSYMFSAAEYHLH